MSPLPPKAFSTNSFDGRRQFRGRSANSATPNLCCSISASADASQVLSACHQRAKKNCCCVAKKIRVRYHLQSSVANYQRGSHWPGRIRQSQNPHWEKCSQHIYFPSYRLSSRLPPSWLYRSSTLEAGADQETMHYRTGMLLSSFGILEDLSATKDKWALSATSRAFQPTATRSNLQGIC